MLSKPESLQVWSVSPALESPRELVKMQDFRPQSNLQSENEVETGTLPAKELPGELPAKPHQLEPGDPHSRAVRKIRSKLYTKMRLEVASDRQGLE